ncbi:prolyl aminopeptidase [Mycoplasmoides alvi]|uniref:prolyl aminopeptidase n=1 Tax=Mycoplasmoides alvi TaxID=78580 RepID=UPI00051BAE24|nr:prolyl aminopeptidase [Mycoplasmoides alvi]
MQKITNNKKLIQNGYLQVSELHKIYWEEWGNPNGIPAVYLHGGPGGSISHNSPRFFDLNKYHLILFDQRGCGNSVPKFHLEDNTTKHLVDDIDKLRNFLKIKKWLIFGGSWGSTLGLSYAIKYPKNVSGLILRGIFLGREKDWNWFLEPTGVAQIFPEKYEKFIEIVPKQNQKNIIHWYYNQLKSKDKQKRIIAGQRWSQWESSLLFFNKTIHIPSNPMEDYQISLMECHYAINKTFFKDPNYILNNVSILKNKPCWLIHGQYDFVCPIVNAYDLNKVLTKSKLIVVKNAGHSSSELGIEKELKKATKEFLLQNNLK